MASGYSGVLGGCLAVAIVLTGTTRTPAAAQSATAPAATVAISLPFADMYSDPAGDVSPDNRPILRVTLASTNSPKQAKAPPLAIGGQQNRKLALLIDPALLSRVALSPDDLQSASLHVPVGRLSSRSVAANSLAVYLLQRKPDHGALEAGTDYDEGHPVASAALNAADHGILTITGLAGALRTIAGGGGYGLVAAIDTAAAGADAPRALITLPATFRKATLDVSLTKHENALLFTNDVVPKPGVFTVMRDGHLFYGDKRLRLWGVVGHGTADRMRKMGFNAERVWEPNSQTPANWEASHDFYTAASAKRGEPAPYVKGDGTRIDQADRHFADLKAHGMFVMFAALTGTMPVEPLLSDDSFIAGGADWAQWKQAISDPKTQGYVLKTAVFFDDRLQRMRKRHAENLLNHVNSYTGKKYGEDEAIAVYEVWNENGFLKSALEDGLDKLPAYFHTEAQRQWNEYLRARYKDDDGLRAAWGTLKPGESLDGAAVALAPILAQRADYPAARAADLIRFLTEKENAFNNDFRAFCRSQAPAGVGVNVAPFSFDTEYKPSIQWPYANAQGDVNCFGMYFWNVNSQLTKPPSMYVIDSHTVAGKATILYETNQGRPDPYRAEYPLELATLGGWQDWDGVFWHYWSAAGLDSDEAFLTEPMPYIAPTHYWTAVDQERDPVMTSAMAIAGRIFLSGAVHPAPTPASYTVGKQGLYSFDLVNGVNQTQATFTRGSRLRFEPNADFKIKSDAEPATATDLGMVHGGDQILWDYSHGRLLVDAPTAKVYVGRAAPSYRFRDGITLSGLSPPFVAWAMVSTDGKPLEAASSAYISSNFDARNTGLTLASSFAGGSPLEEAKGILSWGRAPIRVDAADYTLSFPHQTDWTFVGYDFALRRRFSETARQEPALRVRDQPLWMGLLSISARHGEAAPIVDAPRYAATDAAVPTMVADSKLSSLFNPLPRVSWGDTYADALKALRDGSFLRTSVTGSESSPVQSTITITETELLLGTPADIDVMFTNGRMSRIVATFRRPPVLRDAADALSKQFGPPAESHIVGDQTREDRVTWHVVGAGGDLQILLTEAQGIVTLTYEAKGK